MYIYICLYIYIYTYIFLYLYNICLYMARFVNYLFIISLGTYETFFIADPMLGLPFWENVAPFAASTRMKSHISCLQNVFPRPSEVEHGAHLQISCTCSGRGFPTAFAVNQDRLLLNLTGTTSHDKRRVENRIFNAGIGVQLEHLIEDIGHTVDGSAIPNNHLACKKPSK